MKKATGIKETIRKDGFVQIPNLLIQRFQLAEGDEVELFLGDDTIILKPYSSKNQRIMEQVHTILSGARSVLLTPMYLVDENGENVEDPKTPLNGDQRRQICKFLEETQKTEQVMEDCILYRLFVNWRTGGFETLCLYAETGADKKATETVSRYAATMLARIQV